MQLYRCSPIDSEAGLREAIAYVADASSQLCKKVTGEVLPITSLTVFSHYPAEFDFLKSLLPTLGTLVGGIFGPRIVLNEPIVAGPHTITHLRIREPDPYRAHVGSNDYDIPDYTAFKETYLAAHPENLRIIPREGYELLEFFDPDFDVLGYVLSDPARSKK